MSIWALHDYDEKLKTKGAFNLTKFIKDYKRFQDDADRGNKKGYGIFWVLNDMKDEFGARKKENLKKINFWFCDIDDDSKEEQKKHIEGLLIPPTFVVETKKGYHCYWAVKGEATLDNFEKIEEKLIELLNGDKHCKDPLRLLRCPGYYHMKDPKNPFMVNFVEELGSGNEYTELQMLNWLCRQKEEKTKIKMKYIGGNTSDFLDEKKWDKIFKLSEIGKGNRNGMLSRYTFWLKDEGLSLSEIDYVIRGLNSKLIEPLPEREMNQLLRSKLK